ncbi:hypothetical protein [Mucilaginibacter sp.]|uniref:hypothetical protein n=1 Tax=Mucilaginibacter sp. TaxID=1882438 RepID=UPI0035BBB55D
MVYQSKRKCYCCIEVTFFPWDKLQFFSLHFAASVGEMLEEKERTQSTYQPGCKRQVEVEVKSVLHDDPEANTG